ncbi:MAG: bifunctional phosphoribosyl-AMP cyclohydrolase/phosphoribosyl-ATP diphosphatase HisIE [Calditrichaeota bacterium]|nr:bifunctional phosphoribosyl-AMP cyclohydrolase/phosphoribosyl-ATP diphosphatase HisIE [Calditrichota bacterium]
MNIDFEKSSGLVPVIVQDSRDGRVLMLGYMNREAFQRTLQTGKVTFFSRSRKQLWTKGETSGNELLVKSIQPDCDGDALLIRAIPTGPVCHTGESTCFGNHTNPGWGFLFELERIIHQRRQGGDAQSYTRRLLDQGTAAPGRKLVEESTEVLIAALSEGKARVVEEAADLLYHLLVLLVDQGVELHQVEQVLRKRHQKRSRQNTP